MKRAVLLGLWVVAIVSLSRLFHAQRVWSEAASVGLVLQSLIWLALLAGSMFVLTLRMYALERKRGKVTRPVRVFERILEQKRADGTE